jgi:ribosomal protein S18
MAKRPGGGKPSRPRPNPLIEAGITYIDYKDTNLVRKFISDRGKILPQPSAGRCPQASARRSTAAGSSTSCASGVAGAARTAVVATGACRCMATADAAPGRRAQPPCRDTARG